MVWGEVGRRLSVGAIEYHQTVEGSRLSVKVRSLYPIFSFALIAGLSAGCFRCCLFTKLTNIPDVLSGIRGAGLAIDWQSPQSRHYSGSNGSYDGSGA
jgi:hypothetical protein